MNTQTKTTFKTCPKASNACQAIAAASALLLGHAAQAEGDFWDFSKDWSFDSAVLYYSEADRVQAFEAIVSATRETDVDDKFNFKITLDSLTGATPLGAVVQNTEQTFTRPSGNGQYTVAAGEIPLDDTFRDTRLQLNAQWTKPAWSGVTTSYGLHFSKEFDYLSLAGNGSLAWEFNQKNSVFSLGLSVASDTFSPYGGIPVAHSQMVVDRVQFADDDAYRAAFDATRDRADDTKQTTDLLLGWTQVVNRSTIMQFNYSYSSVNGYLSDPFKVYSVVDNTGTVIETNGLYAHYYENRPDSRAKHSIFGQVKHHFDESIADFSLRYMTDDWDIDSQTVDYKHLFYVGENSYIEPQFRYYQQSAANFYLPYLLDSQAQPEFASSDIRLGEFTAYTLGFKYGWKTDSGNDIAVRLSYYQQTPKDVLGNHPGQLANAEIYPDLDAFFVQFSYSF